MLQFAVPEKVFGEKNGGKKTNTEAPAATGSLCLADRFGKAEDQLGLDVISYFRGFVCLFMTFLHFERGESCCCTINDSVHFFESLGKF